MALVDNYIIALRLFLNYAIGQSNFTEEIIIEMEKIEDKLVMVNKGATKQMNKDSSNKSFLNLNNKEVSLKDIKKIVDDSELVDKFKKMLDKIESKRNILPGEYILLVQYIFAVIVLTKFQRPGVIYQIIKTY